MIYKEVILEKSYGLSVDIYLYGLLMYEMLLGVPAFPCRNSVEEQEENIKKGNFSLPDNLLSEEAISLLKGIIVVEAKDRLSIEEIKNHMFFKGLDWSAVERVELQMPEPMVREPNAANFEDITYDSADEDWQHEFEDSDYDES